MTTFDKTTFNEMVKKYNRKYNRYNMIKKCAKVCIATLIILLLILVFGFFPLFDLVLGTTIFTTIYIA